MQPLPENTQKSTKTTSDTQTCRYCKKSLSLQNFQITKRFPNGRYPICRNCRNESRARNRITPEEYKSLLKAQNYRCAICGIEADKLSKALNVDHNHSTHKIRGLLCLHCNLGLGYFKDNTETLETAINYLEATDA